MTLEEITFIDRGDVVHLLGPPETGKTHLATALGVAMVKAGKRVYWITLVELIDNLIQTERAGRLQVKIRNYLHPSLFIIDEIDFLPITPRGAMILTSNLGFACWRTMFGDPVMATALLDRLLHHLIVITITGHSYRLRDYMELVTDNIRSNKSLLPPPPPRKRGCKKKPKGGEVY